MLKVAGGVGGGGGGNGTVTSVNTGTGLTGGPITTSGTIRLANTAVTAGTYGSNVVVPQIVIDAQGRITSASNVTIDVGGSGTVTQVNTGTGLTGGPVTTTGTISLANTAVIADSYGSANTVATFTVNQQGQLTAAGNAAINIAVANVSGAVPNTVNVLAAGLLTGGGALTGNVTLSLTSVPVANVSGAVVNTTTITAGTGLNGGGNLASNVTINLANTAVTAGTYGNSTQVAQITIDAQGRITAASNVAITGGGGGGNVSADTAYAYAWFIS